jgi:DNA-binding transcriptional MerR regulator
MSAYTAPMRHRAFRSPEVCVIAGLTYRQLDYWARTELLVPSITNARGSGTQRRYSYHDVLELKVISELLTAGLSLSSARRAIDCLRLELGEDIASANLVISGGGSILARSGQEIIDVLKSGRGVLNIVPMAALASEIEATCTELYPQVGGPE